jgi:formate dehydrogenase (NADP+) beta subunit
MGAMRSGKKSTAPCREACPAGIDVPRYVRQIREGHFDQALAVIRERIPFPFVCGYACVHPCETKCARAQFDQPIAIRMLKKAAAENGGRKPVKVAKRPPTGKRVAVIGSGPCGLTAAFYLNSQGHQVTVYEALPLPGGMLRYGIPEYRLPEEIVDREIATIREAGVEIVSGAKVSSAESLLDKGFAAVLVATGAWKPSKMGVPGEDSPGVIDGLSFLSQVNEGHPPAIGRRVVVVGGGNTAIDAARASIRLGAEVTLLYRRTRAEMPAGSEEVVEALEEGVCLEYLTAPVKIEKGRASCIRMQLGDADASGRRAPVPIPGSEYAVEFDTLIMAIGQSADAASVHLEGQKNGTVPVDPGSLATVKRGIFASGDAVRGPSTIIEAIAQGRLACASIDRFLGGTGIIPEALSEETAAEPPEAAQQGTKRPKARMIPLKRRRSTFEPVERTCPRGEASAEASRCLSCDLRDFDVEVNGLICKDCGYCREVCSLGVFGQSAEFNPSGYKPAVAENTDKCIGCLRCLYICPDFAITIREKA